MGRNIFHQSNHEYIYSTPCHFARLTEEMFNNLKWYVGLHAVYNAMGHLLKRYDTASTLAIWNQDVGDYYALRILESMHLLVSQGKGEDIS